MKSINVYNALVAYKASKEARWNAPNDMLTFDIDGNQVKLAFCFLDDYIKKYEKLAKQESKPIKPPSIPVSNNRCLALQNYYIEVKEMDKRTLNITKRQMKRDVEYYGYMPSGSEYLTNKERLTILELF